MVSKSLTFIALLMCAILAQTVVAKTDNQSQNEDLDSDSGAVEGEDSESNNDYEESDDDEDDETKRNDYYPFSSLSCITSSDLGCNIECSVVGKAFGLPSSGTCGKREICQCAIDRNVSSLNAMWKAKFDSSDILNEIKKDKKLAKKVRAILASPSLLTSYETKQALKSILSDDQYQKLILKDNSKAAKMIGKDGKLDLAAIKKHVTDELPKTLKSSDRQELSGLKYKPTLLKALKKANDYSKNNFSNLASDIRRTNNKSLSDILDEYLKKNNINEPTTDKETSTVANTITYHVVDALVNIVDRRKATTVNGKEASAKKVSTTRKFQSKKSSKKSKVEDEESAGKNEAQDMNDQKSVSENNQEESEVDNDEDDQSDADIRFTLIGFNNKNVISRPGPINQKWSKNGWTVRYQRDDASNVTIEWTKGSDKVVIKKYGSSLVNQDWTFGKVKINISARKQPHKQIDENWNFGKNSYQYSRAPAGDVKSTWSTGDADNKKLDRYQKLIDAWCTANSFLINWTYCAVYESKAN